MQIAMKNGDRDAIRSIMQFRNNDGSRSKKAVSQNEKSSDTAPSPSGSLWVNSNDYRRFKMRKKLKIKQQQRVNNNCAICMEPLKSSDSHLYVTSCNHRFHRSCIERQKLSTNKCCLCRRVICEPPPMWYEKYLGQPGYRWLDTVVSRRNAEKEFEEMMNIEQICADINSDSDSDCSSSCWSDYFTR